MPGAPHPFAIGGNVWPGISKLIEEAGEVGQVAGKLIATGGQAAHWDGTDLKDRLQDEIADLMAASSFVIDHNDLNAGYIQRRAGLKRSTFESWHRGELDAGAIIHRHEMGPAELLACAQANIDAMPEGSNLRDLLAALVGLVGEPAQ